jgi:hypothetical protein
MLDRWVEEGAELPIFIILVKVCSSEEFKVYQSHFL